MLAPGMYEKQGGMFSYTKLWLNEVRKYVQSSSLLMDERFRDDLSDSRVLFRSLRSEVKWKGLFISSAAVILPMAILKIFFIDYRDIVRKFSQIHILTSFLFAYPLIRSLFAFNDKITLIYTLHDPVPHEEKRGGIAKRLKKRYLEKIYRLSRRNPNFFLHLHSEALLADCSDVAGKVIIHPHPLPERLVTVRKDNFQGVVFGFLGRMESYKGLDVLLNAFEKIADNKETPAPIKIMLAGSGDLNIEAWKKLPFEVEIHNRRVSELEFHTFMAGLHCLLLPYRKATQSGVGYLALSYEIPIIATDTGGLPDIVQQSKDTRSALIPPNDMEALKEAILTFIQKDLKRG